MKNEMAKQPNVEIIIDAILSIIAESNLKLGEMTPWSPIQQRLIKNDKIESEIMDALQRMGDTGLLEAVQKTAFIKLTESGFERMQLLDG
jgi:DNA-binding PucR family transcriptional regulator